MITIDVNNLGVECGTFKYFLNNNKTFDNESSCKNDKISPNAVAAAILVLINTSIPNNVISPMIIGPSILTRSLSGTGIDDSSCCFAGGVFLFLPLLDPSVVVELLSSFDNSAAGVSETCFSKTAPDGFNKKSAFI